MNIRIPDLYNTTLSVHTVQDCGLFLAIINDPVRSSRIPKPVLNPGPLAKTRLREPNLATLLATPEDYGVHSFNPAPTPFQEHRHYLN